MTTLKRTLPDPDDSWQAKLIASHEKRVHRHNVVDDGFYSHMAKNAKFVGIFEIPYIGGADVIIPPPGMTPFSMLGRADSHDECVCFFEQDPMFADAIVAAEDFIDDLRNFSLVSSPDCSLYRDMPLAIQIANVYLSRLVGCYYEKCGLSVVPTVRWADERSYSTVLFPEPFAFAGLKKGGVYAIGTYGCIQGSENKFFFREGLGAMLEYLTPRMVFVYGAMPKSVFGEYLGITQFVRYDDWITRKRGGHG